jgi:hypothetical protein
MRWSFFSSLRTFGNHPKSMSKFIVAIIAVLFVAGAGCASHDNPSDISLVLKGSHRFILSLEKQSAFPGEIVMARLEFTNTGSEPLWVPTRNELFFGWERKQGSGSEGGGLWSSFCDGLQYKKIRPGQKLEYEKGFVVPAVPPGDLLVYISDERATTASLTVR